jgi:hypothetical protein
MKRIMTVVALAVLLPLASFARGAGGVTFGTQVFSLGAANPDLGLMSLGGFGYGVSRWGQRIGGFGQAFLGFPRPGSYTACGVGGLLAGQELRAGPVVVGLNLLLGAGGMGSSFFPPYGGYAIGFGEVTLDAGIALAPWMLVSAYGGMQAMTNLIPGRPFSNVVIYSPVAGVRLSWGWFAD